MTIDEAIKHCEEVAWENDIKAMCVEETYQTTEQQNCEQCAAEHRQLAEWLKDYKEAKRLLLLANADIYYYSGKKWEYEADVLKLIGDEENGTQRGNDNS